MTTLPGKDLKGAVAPEKTAAEDMPITDWMEKFRQIYENVDSKRTPVQMWVAATSHFTTMGEAIRCMNFTNLMKSAAHAFCWMCSFILACQREKGTVFSLDESFSDIVTCKYPLVCGYCREATCHCDAESMERMANKPVHYKDLLEKRRRLNDAPDRYSVPEWRKIFKGIYGQRVHMLTLESLGFHFLEEAGEELTAVRGLMQLAKVLQRHLEGIDEELLAELATFERIVPLYDKYWNHTIEMKSEDPEAIKVRLVRAKVDMFIEFADTFSWFCSILNKLKSIAENCEDGKCRFTQQAFQDRLIQEYLPDGKPRCPTCKECPCGCVFYN